MTDDDTALSQDRLITDQRVVAWLLIAVVLAFLAAGSAGGVTAFFLLRVDEHPPEQTAKLLPANTQVYVSLNLRPGGDQLGKFRAILERFRQHSGFQQKLDELFNKINTDSGIHPEDDVLSWLGPEVAIAAIDVTGAAMAAATGGVPLMAALLGTTDPEKSAAVLQRLLEHLRVEEALTFVTYTYKEVDVFAEGDTDQYYALAGDYVVFATDQSLVENVISRILDGEEAGSLFGTDRFTAARDSLPEERFATLYIDTESIWSDARRELLAPFLTAEMRSDLDDTIPAWVAVADSFIDNGVTVTASFPTPAQALETPEPINTLSAAGFLPADTMAFLSFAFEPSLDPIREQLRGQTLEDLAPGTDAVSEFGLMPGFGFGDDQTLDELLDGLLTTVRDAVGIDLEEDVLGWMGGEFALGILPTDFRQATADPPTEAYRAAALIQVDPQQRDKVLLLMGKIEGLLQDFLLPAALEEVTYGGGQGTVIDVGDLVGAAYQPGYLLVEDQLVIATTREILESAAAAGSGEKPSLATEPEYSRLIETLTGDKNPLLYLDLRAIREAIVSAFDQDTRKDYEKDGEPFVEPLRSLIASVDIGEGVSRSTLTVTIE